VKRHLSAKLHGVRGIHAHPEVLRMVEAMTEAQAEAWFRVLQNFEEDAKSSGAHEGARQPWRHGRF
jgi:hypothetical protein